MPEEMLIMTVFAIVAGSVLTIVRMILGYRERTRGVTGKAGGSSMTTSELEKIIRSAVRDALDPVARRVERLEDRLAPQGEPLQLPARNRTVEIEDHELDAYAPEEEPARRLRAR